MSQRRELAVSMVLRGEEPGDVSEVLGVSERSIWRWLSAWRRLGMAGLLTRPGWGRRPKLTDPQSNQVLRWLEHDPSEFGFTTERWTAPRVAALIDSRFGVRMNHRYLNAWLARRGITPQVPERRPLERNQMGIETWIARQWPIVKKK